MDGLTEKSRTRPESAGAGPPTGRAILRGPARPDLIRRETLASLFRDSARARAQAPCLIDAAASGPDGRPPVLTYGAVDARSDRLAAALAARGIGPGDVVGLWMARGTDLLIAQIAIAKSGAAWLPFDAEAPADRVAVCLSDAEAKALLVSDALRPQAPEGVAPLTTAELLGAAAEGAAAPDLDAAGLTPEHPAYLIYTSGSTGVPKGIVISHANICHFLRSGNAVYGMAPEDVVFQGASVAFDLSMEEIWVPYLVGACLYVASPAMMGDVEALPGLIARAGVTVLDTVPTLLAMIPATCPPSASCCWAARPCPSRWWRVGRRPSGACSTPTARPRRPWWPPPPRCGRACPSPSAARSRTIPSTSPTRR